MKGKITMYYVTMTDGFMSGWGKSENKISKFVVECETMKQAETIEKNARKRQEMKYVNIATRKPYYNNNKYITTFRQFGELGRIWTV